MEGHLEIWASYVESSISAALYSFDWRRSVSVPIIHQDHQQNMPEDIPATTDCIAIFVLIILDLMKA